MLKSRTHFEQVPVALAEKLLKRATESILREPEKAKRRVSENIAAQQIRVQGAKS